MKTKSIELNIEVVFMYDEKRIPEDNAEAIAYSLAVESNYHTIENSVRLIRVINKGITNTTEFNNYQN